MPVDRVPVVHKFGIISHTQRLALEDRLAKKSLADEPPRTFSRTRRVPFEVTEDFIAKFNDSNEEDRKELEGFALKMISRAKRRAGILAGGKGDHVDLARSWTELGLLAQCTNRQVQEESLELLITSLGHAPPTEDQLPSLFYLAKSCLHWLRKCGMNQTCLRTAELKLVRMGHLAFTRLYYHNMTQDLKGYQDEKRSLLQYLSGLRDEQEEAYKSFPGVLLAVRYIKEVGQLICTGCGEPYQEDSSIIEPLPEPARAHEPEPASQEKPVAEATAVEATEGGRVGLPLLLEEEEEEEQGSGDLGFNEAVPLSPAHSPAAASSIHDLSPTLWHALDVWRSVMHRGTGLRQALEGLSMCGTGLTTELWLDVCCAFQVLTEVSKQEIAVLRTFQALAAGIFTRPTEISSAHARPVHLCNNCLSNITGHQSLNAKGFPDDDLNFDQEKHRSPSGYLSLGKTPSLVRGLRDFADLGLDDKPVRLTEDVEESIASRDSLSDTSSEASFADVSSVESGRRGRSGHVNARSGSNMSKTYKKTRRTEAKKSESSSESEGEIEKPEKTQIKSSKQSDIPKKETNGSARARGGTAVRFNVQEPEVSNTEGGVPAPRMERSFTKDSLYTQGSSVTLQLADEDDKSSTKTGTSQFSAPGLNGWRWELAYLYTDCMTSVCMNGQSSIIQKTALLGSEANQKVTVYGKRNAMSREGLGLLDLLKLRFPLEQDQMLARKDWSWRVRFAAVQGLVRICRQSTGDSTKDGIRGVAWNQLMRHHSQERDVRVLEAWKLAQIESVLDNKLPSLDAFDSLFPSWAASNLSAVLLPPLPPVVPPSSRSRPRARSTPLNKPAPAVKKGPKRPSLRQEILLATAAREPQADYRSRMNHDLMLVIEDQWRKQLHEEQKQEEEDRRREEAARVEGIVMKEGRRSRQRKEGDGTVVGDTKEGTEGRRSGTEALQDGKMMEVEMGSMKGRRSRQEETVEGTRRTVEKGRSSGQGLMMDK
ncbi:hypothetical protein ACROYT_G027190 [Oculina patagonica]